MNLKKEIQETLFPCYRVVYLEKRMSAGGNRVSVRGVPTTCRPFSGIDSPADGAPRMFTADRNAGKGPFTLNVNGVAVMLLAISP